MWRSQELARGILHLVALEAGGVVDEKAERAERLARPGHQCCRLAFVREIGAKGCGPPARCRDLGHHFLSRTSALVVMDGDREAPAREVEGERAADAPRGPRHQGHLRHALRHGTTMTGSPASIKAALLTGAQPAARPAIAWRRICRLRNSTISCQSGVSG